MSSAVAHTPASPRCAIAWTLGWEQGNTLKALVTQRSQRATDLNGEETPGGLSGMRTDPASTASGKTVFYFLLPWLPCGGC